MLGLVKTLALEGAERRVLATAVCPGFVRTPLVEAQIADQARSHGLPEERVLNDVISQPHAVKRLIEPEEVAEAVAFLGGPGGLAFTGVGGADGLGLDRELSARLALAPAVVLVVHQRPEQRPAHQRREPHHQRTSRATIRVPRARRGATGTTAPAERISVFCMPIARPA